MGRHSGDRNVVKEVEDETFSVTFVEADDAEGQDLIRVTAFGQTQDFKNPELITRIEAYGDSGSDSITIGDGITQDLILSGDEGTDRISVLSGGDVTIDAGNDDDVVHVSIATGQVSINLGYGNDRLSVDSAGGNVSIGGEAGADQISVTIAGAECDRRCGRWRRQRHR